MKNTDEKIKSRALAADMKQKCFVYLRVSTAEQDEKSQLIGIKKHIEKEKLPKPTILKDTVSGATPWRRRMLNELERLADRGDWLIISELSRIGRTTSDVLDFLAWATVKGLQIYIVKHNIQIDDSIQSKIFTTILSLTAELEREFVRARTREGMANAAAKGRSIGRPRGPARSHRLDKERDDIERMLDSEVPKAAIARLKGISVGTLDRAINSWKRRGKQENG